MRDMSPSPTTRSPWWICDDFLWNLFIFFHKNTHRLFYQTADIVLEKTLILFSGRYWAKCRPQVYHSHGLQLFSKGTTLWTFFFFFFNSNSTYYCTFQANNNFYLLNGLANLWLSNPSVFVSMCFTSFLLFQPLIKMYVSMSVTDMCLVTQPFVS